MSRGLGVALVLIVGLGGIAIQLFHAFEPDENLPSVFLGVVVPSPVALGLVLGAIWLARSDIPTENRLLVAGWCLVGAVLMGLSGVVTILYQGYGGTVLTGQPYVVANTAVTGALAGFVVGVYDAQRRVVSDTLAEERARAERLSQRLTVVNRVLRHDVRNSVNVIHGYADKLVKRFDDDDARRIRDRIIGLYELTEMARTMERSIGDGGDPIAVDLVPVVESIVEAARTDHPEAEVKTDLPRSRRVYANSFLEIALENVVDNAIRYNDADAQRVAVSLSMESSDGAALVALRIADDGPGMPPDQQAVFERGRESPLAHSTGTGLWLANWIVEDVGGGLSIESGESGGTTVVVRLREVPDDDPGDRVRAWSGPSGLRRPEGPADTR